MNGSPVDDKIVAPMFALYRQGLELLLKSVLQRIHFKNRAIKFDSEFDRRLRDNYGHDLQKLHNHLEELFDNVLGHSDLKGKVGYLVQFFTDDARDLMKLRYGGAMLPDEVEPFNLVALHGELNQSWVHLCLYADLIVADQLSTS